MRLRARSLVAASLLALAAGCGGSSSAAGPSDAAPAPTTAPVTTGAPVTTATAPTSPQVIASGLRVPWGLAFLPDGSALVSERETSAIYQVFPGGGKKVLTIVPHVQPRGEGGLLGLAVDKTYATDRWVYAYYSAATDNRIVRFHLATPNVQQVLFTGIPHGTIHNGGRIAFGPDGMLYVGTGETGDRPLAQDLHSLGGKILRLTPLGKPAPGNPFPGSPVYSYGHRNVQGLTWDAQGRLWALEFGQDTYDEVNLIRPGGDYGWPVVEGKDTGGGKYLAPKVIWKTSEASPSGIAYADGALYVGALRGTRLWRVPLDGTSTGTPTQRYQGTYGRLRTVALEPDGKALWVTTSNCDGRGTCPSPGGDVVLRVPLSSS